MLWGASSPISSCTPLEWVLGAAATRSRASFTPRRMGQLFIYRNRAKIRKGARHRRSDLSHMKCINYIDMAFAYIEYHYDIDKLTPIGSDPNSLRVAGESIG
jgi:hypothetical protein